MRVLRLHLYDPNGLYPVMIEIPDYAFSTTLAIDCSSCSGVGAQSGAHTDRVEPCPTCEGSGRKKVEAQG